MAADPPSRLHLQAVHRSGFHSHQAFTPFAARDGLVSDQAQHRGGAAGRVAGGFHGF